MTDVAIDNFIAHHPPAIKVGGRRHSVSAKHRPRRASEPTPVAAPLEPEPATDYPRPAAPGEEAPAPDHVPPHNNEEEAPRKDKKHDANSERKLLELAQRKAEMARPTRDFNARGHGKGVGGAGRISQPMKDVHI